VAKTTNSKADARKLETLLTFAADTLEKLLNELREEHDADFCTGQRREAGAAIAWLEEKLAELPCRKGVPFHKGRRSAAELDWLVRYGIKALYAVRAALGWDRTTRRATRWAFKGSWKLTSRLDRIRCDRAKRKRPKPAPVPAVNPVVAPAAQEHAA
jgi:hypothetical protein